MYITSVLTVLSSTLSHQYITSYRKDATATDNPNTNDTYEYIEGATSNQRKKGKNFNIHLHIYSKLDNKHFKRLY